MLLSLCCCFWVVGVASVCCGDLVCVAEVLCVSSKVLKDVDLVCYYECVFVWFCVDFVYVSALSFVGEDCIGVAEELTHYLGLVFVSLWLGVSVLRWAALL